MKKTYIFGLIGAMVLVGGGCGRLASNKPAVQPPAAPAAPTLTRETVDLATAEIFLRSRDDVAPGQAETNRQSLFAKSTDGQIVELIKDVHDALGSNLKADAYLVQVKNVPNDAQKKFVYFTVGAGKQFRLFAYNKETRAFDAKIPVVHAAINSFDAPQFSPDGRRVAIFSQAELYQKRSTQAVYVGDFATGEVTHRYVLPAKFILNDGKTPAVQKPTTWVTPEAFKVALYKADGTDGGTQTPSDVVQINATAKITEVPKNVEYQLDPVVLRLFGPHADGYEISAGAFQTFSAVGPADATDFVMPEVSKESPYVFVLGQDDFGFKRMIAIYDRGQRKFLLEDGVPKQLIVYDGISAIFSPSHKRLAFVERGNPETVHLIDLMTLKAVSQKVPEQYTTFASVQFVPDTETRSLVQGEAKWKNDNEFVYSLYSLGEERDIKGGKKEIVNKFVKNQSVKFDEESGAISVNTFTHPKFGFSFAIPQGVVVKMDENGADAWFLSEKLSTIEYGRLIVQPDIPGVPLAPDKIEAVTLGGVKAFLYHDTDGADGGKLDKLIGNFPSGKNTVYLSALELPAQPMWNLKLTAASWKWGK